MDDFRQAVAPNDHTAEFDTADIEKNRNISLFSYIGLLFFVPLLAAKDSRFARFHANQGLVLCLAGVAGWAVFAGLAALFGLIPVVGDLLGFVFRISEDSVGILFLIFAIIGIVNILRGQAKDLPLIGKIKILK